MRSSRTACTGGSSVIQVQSIGADGVTFRERSHHLCMFWLHLVDPLTKTKLRYRPADKYQLSQTCKKIYGQSLREIFTAFDIVPINKV